MYSFIDQETKSNVENALKADTREFRQRITFGYWNVSYGIRTFVSDVEIEQGVNSLHISQKSNSNSSGLLMGCCCSSCAEVEFYNPEKSYNYSDKIMFVESGIKLSDGNFCFIPLGYYKTEAPESDDDWYTVRVKAYDDIYQMTSKWSTKLTYPDSVYNVLYELAQKYSITIKWTEQNYATWAKARKITADEANILSNYTEREVLGYLTGLLGFNARMNTIGSLSISWYYKYDDVNISADVQWQNGFKKTLESAFTVSSVTSGINDTVYTSGTGKGLTFANPIIKQSDVIQIYSRLANKTFQPCECEWRGNPCVEAGDIVTVTDKNDNTHTVFIAEQEIDLTGGLSMRISCPSGDADISFDTVGWQTMIELRKQKTELQQAIQKATELINGAKGGYYEVFDSDSDGNPDGWMIKEDEGGIGGIIKATKYGIGISRDGGKNFTEAITYEGIVASAINCADLEAIGATIGGWNITDDGIYKDVDNYRAYINSPYKAGDDTWVFSTQEYKGEDVGYQGTFYVTIKGDMHVQRIDSDKTIYTNCAGDDSVFGAIEHNRYDLKGSFGMGTTAEGFYSVALQLVDPAISDKTKKIKARLDVSPGSYSGCVTLQTTNAGKYSYLTFFEDLIFAGKSEDYNDTSAMLNFKANRIDCENLGVANRIDCETLVIPIDGSYYDVAYFLSSLLERVENLEG